MDTAFRCFCLLTFVLSAIGPGLSVHVQPLTNRSEKDGQLPPEIFPNITSLEAINDGESEVPDLLRGNVNPAPHPEAEPVDHPNTVDPGTTHQERGIASNSSLSNQTSQALAINAAISTSTTEDAPTPPDDSMNVTTTAPPKSGVVYTCNFPKSWLKRSENASQDFMNDNSTGNDTNLCSFPPDWIKEINNDTLHICTIHKEWLKANNYTIQNGTIPKDLLADMNTTNISCVTPKEDLTNDDNNYTSHYSNIPRAWLKEGNDIYIYLVPEDVLNNITDTSEEVTTVPTVSNVTSVVNTSSEITTALGRVPLTSDFTTIKNMLNNATDNGTVEEIVNRTAAPVTTVKSVASSTSTTTPIPPVEEEAHAVQPSAVDKGQKNTTKADDDADSNRTKQDEEQDTESVSPAVEDNVIDGSGATDSPTPGALLPIHADHDHKNGKAAFLQPTESAAILAGVFVGIALLGYVGLLAWRRILERRYGNREMLVNEEDDFDTSDMRHFEMQNTRSSSIIIK